MGKEEDTKLGPGLDRDPLQDETSVSAVASNDRLEGVLDHEEMQQKINNIFADHEFHTMLHTYDGITTTVVIDDNVIGRVCGMLKAF